MCPVSLASALITSPSADSDLLMACASFRVSPDAPDFFTLRQSGWQQGAERRRWCLVNTLAQTE